MAVADSTKETELQRVTGEDVDDERKLKLQTYPRAEVRDEENADVHDCCEGGKKKKKHFLGKNGEKCQVGKVAA